ncbi:MAG: hypothetical protein K2N73_03435 [Lachnospiraceae bacterium]|nr:hypothetical protein [Lachnospiraceae bacterium]
MRRKIIKYTVILLSSCILGIGGCSFHEQTPVDSSFQFDSILQTNETVAAGEPDSSGRQTNETVVIEDAGSSDNSVKINTDLNEDTVRPDVPAETEKNMDEGNKQDKEEITEISDNFKMETYVEAPNGNSSVKIIYPVFEGSEAEKLNLMVYNKVQELGKIDMSILPDNISINVEYQSAVTLKNKKIASIVFWGESYFDDDSDITTMLSTVNIDLQSMQEITLADLYNTNERFKEVFFEKAVFPENPVTSYDASVFRDMLALQTPEYRTVDPFSISGNVVCFLKPEGIVLSMPSVHATGNDHFEAQLDYQNIQEFYLPNQNYWEN